MANGDFDRERRLVNKYGSQRLDFLTYDEYRAKYHLIQQDLLQVFPSEQTNAEDEGDYRNIFVGGIILGSWVGGLVHNRSDLDIFGISKLNILRLGAKKVEKLEDDFAYAVAAAVQQPVEMHGTILTGDDFAIMKIKSGRHMVIGKDYKVISRDPKVLRLFE